MLKYGLLLLLSQFGNSADLAEYDRSELKGGWRFEIYESTCSMHNPNLSGNGISEIHGGNEYYFYFTYNGTLNGAASLQIDYENVEISGYEHSARTWIIKARRTDDLDQKIASGKRFSLMIDGQEVSYSSSFSGTIGNGLVISSCLLVSRLPREFNESLTRSRIQWMESAHENVPVSDRWLPMPFVGQIEEIPSYIRGHDVNVVLRNILRIRYMKDQFETTDNYIQVRSRQIEDFYTNFGDRFFFMEEGRLNDFQFRYHADEGLLEIHPSWLLRPRQRTSDEPGLNYESIQILNDYQRSMYCSNSRQVAPMNASEAQNVLNNINKYRVMHAGSLFETEAVWQRLRSGQAAERIGLIGDLDFFSLEWRREYNNLGMNKTWYIDLKDHLIYLINVETGDLIELQHRC